MNSSVKAIALVLSIISAPFFAEAEIPVQKHRVRLSDNWEFLGEDLGSAWEYVRPVKSGQPESVPEWHHISVPHSYNSEDCVDPDVDYLQGVGWYRTRLKIENPYPSGRIILEFSGAGQKTSVYIHTKKVGEHIGGYDSWYVDITDAVNEFMNGPYAGHFDGMVPVGVRCDNSRDAEMIPSSMSDFNVYGGLYRPVSLIYLPPLSVTSVHVTPKLDKRMRQGTFDVDAEFYNPYGITEAKVRIVLKSGNGEVIFSEESECEAPSGKMRLGTYQISRPELWSPESPSLYGLEVLISSSGHEFEAAEKFGFRDFVFMEKGPFLLNGKRLLLRGTHRHEDHAGVGPAMSDSLIRREMKMIKDMGANFIRLGHYQQSDIVLDLCDSLGILVWEEIPWCRGGLGGERYRKQAKDMLAAMISQHYNHPSVILWGLGNENDWPGDFPEFDRDEIRGFMSELNDIAHSMDPSRKTSIRRCAFCSDIVDVYSPSIWAGWYSGKYSEYRSKTEQEMSKVSRFFHAEWGGDSHAGRNTETVALEVEKAAANGDWSENYIVKLFDWHLKEQETMPYLSGSAFWTFKDFSTPLRPENPIPYVNQKGVVERDLTPKESYYVFQSYWSDVPMLHIYGHNWPVRWDRSLTDTLAAADCQGNEVLVYSNLPEVELFLNGQSMGIRKRNPQDFPAAGLHWYLKFRPGHNVLKAVSEEYGLEDTVEFEYRTQKWGTPAAISIETAALPDDCVRVKIQVTDSLGRECLDAADFVRFGLTGDGTLVSNLGTSGGSSKIQAANGRATITVRKNGGRSCLSVRYPGVETALVVLE